MLLQKKTAQKKIIAQNRNMKLCRNCAFFLFLFLFLFGADLQVCLWKLTKQASNKEQKNQSKNPKTEFWKLKTKLIYKG